MATNVGFTKDIWKEAAIVDLWYKIRFTLVIVGMMDMMHLCFHLAVFPRKPIFFMIKRPMEFSEWACLKDSALPRKNLSFGRCMTLR